MSEEMNDCCTTRLIHRSWSSDRCDNFGRLDSECQCPGWMERERVQRKNWDRNDYGDPDRNDEWHRNVLDLDDPWHRNDHGNDHGDSDRKHHWHWDHDRDSDRKHQWHRDQYGHAGREHQRQPNLDMDEPWHRDDHRHSDGDDNGLWNDHRHD